MSFTTPELILRCPQCGGDLAPGALACERCRALVHGAELDRLAAAAKELEAQKQLRQARDLWTQGLVLLPRDSSQAEWIRNHTQELLNAALADELPKARTGTQGKWAKRLAPLGPVAVVLAKGKAVLVAIFKLKFLLSLLAFVGVYAALFGYKFGIGFAVMILIHEMGHFIDIKLRGLPAEMPVFLPGFGAYVKWQAQGVSIETRSAISLAGPLAGWIAAVACAMVWFKTGNHLWAALARTGAWLNVLNLIPIWVLDGGQATLALGKISRLLLAAAGLALWFAMGERLFLVVAAGAAWRVFTKDMPVQSSFKVTAYYLAVLTGLALVLRILPGQGLMTR